MKKLITALASALPQARASMHKKYDALKDFDIITVAVQAPNVLVVPASSPHRTVAPT
jgi:tripartite-type tricarboxylate transporter receptor subunit TctC